MNWGWAEWAISGAGAAFLITAAVGLRTQPDGPPEARVRHGLYRVLLPFMLGWAFFLLWLPRALGAPWFVSDLCRLVAMAPVVLLAVAARRRAR
ncbi:hypothetical protein ACFW9D_13235 [Streptomyces sp. NPDC059524]|uniref:hypothetical protein n=1 Tax=Streptomyces sp. NPDC059524 TaxID=3346856 RepID=UPI00368A18E6